MMDVPTPLQIDEVLADVSTRINEFELEKECTTVSGYYATWNAKLSVVEKAMRLAEHEHEMLVARLGYRHREELRVRNGKATEREVDDALRMDIDVDRSQRELIEAQVAHTRVRGILRALEMKRDMLRELGAHTRQEKWGDPIVRRQHQRHGEVEENNG